jgi:hypothetical protein
MERLLDDLEAVRRATVVHSAVHKGRPRVTIQLEHSDPDLAAFLASMGVKE